MGPNIADLYTRRRFLAAATVGTAGLIGAGYGAGSNELDVTHPTRPVAGTHPEPGPALRIAVITDMHSPHDYVEGKHLIASVQRFKPHIVAIVGDAVDRHGQEGRVDYYAALDAPLGKFATLGNWEYQGRCDLGKLKRQYDRAGVRLLVNEPLRLDNGGAPVDLVGLDDWRAGLPDFSILSRVPAAGPEGRLVVMSHCPVTFNAIREIAPRPSTVLAGHTHGGQIAPFGLAILLPEGSGPYVRGWYQAAAGHAMYVSRGLGNSGLPFRIGSRPELVLLTI
jgi:predicted MPP superfamily phosphohydrolase